MAELDALEARLDSITASVQHAQTQTPNAVAYITDAVANTTAKLPDLQALHDSLNITDDTMVAFSTGDGSITYNYGSTNPIDLTPATPDYNTGAYDEASSTFVAPRDGLYLFILRTTVGYSVNVEMLLNGVEVITAANSGGYYDIKMRVAIRFLSAGDYVALYSGGTGSGTVYQSNGLFFSGLLLTGNKKLMPDFRNV
nr:hypothetical protein BaRGS_024981 [Batillaria attramentaria]